MSIRAVARRFQKSRPVVRKWVCRAAG
ncbi:hypothetical protein [Rhizorhabdus sp.]